MSTFNLSAWAVKHPALVLYLMFTAGAAGLYAYLGMGRAEDPSFTIKTMVVTADWPGATSDEVRRQVADRIEEKLQETPYLDYLKTYCLPGRAVITVQLRNDTPPKAVPDLWYQVRKKVGDIKHTLPEGVIGPFLDDEYGDVYVAVYAFTGSDYTPAELKRLAQDARRRLLRVKDVSKVTFVGLRPEKVFVEFSHKKLATLGVTPQQVFDSLRRQNAIAPAGSVETPTDRVYVRVEGPFSAAEKVKAVPVHAGGRVFQVGDIAEVRRGFEDPPTFIVRHNGKPAVEVAVAMSKGGNVLALGRALDAELKAIEADLPAGAAVETVAFQPHVVEESVGEFTRSFVEALVIVLVVSFLSLGWRSGVVVALSVPLVLAISLVVMNAAGINLDRISLGALILALGLLVDDAIIAVEMMVVKMEEGYDRIQAATFAWTSTAFPMLTGTLVTVVGFLPVGFAKSVAGEYAGGIFWVVGIALVASWLVAVLFTPYLGVRLLRDYTKRAHHDPYHTRMYRLLRWAITACVSRPRAVVAVTAVLFVTAVFGMQFVPKQFFPQSSRAELMVEFRLPGGSSFTATEAEVAKLEAILAGDPEIDHFTAYIGAGPPRFYMALNPDLPDPSFAKVVIQTRDPTARERLRARLLERFAADTTFALPRMRVVRLEFGPPVGFPVQFRVVGPNPDTVRENAHRVRDVVRQNPHTRDTQLEWDEPSKLVRLRVDQDRARAIGLTPQDVAATLQTLLTGMPVSQYREGIELIDVVARAVPEERLKLDSLPDLTVITPAGLAVPLSQVVTFAYEQEEPIRWRRDRETVLTVRADVIDGIQAPDVTAAILPKLESIKASLPPGYRIDTGGEVEESQKANSALFAMFPIMIAIMLTLLMAQVQSFKKLFLVFVISPLGLIGAVASLLLFDAPFGFNALLGVIALAGMDMRNSVILIDQIEHNMANGMSAWDAVIESAVRRSRPVVLTAATAILAMIPLTRSVFWGPLAVAIMGGLSVATFLTLGNLPALYVLLFQVKRPTNSPAPSTRTEAQERGVEAVPPADAEGEVPDREGDVGLGGGPATGHRTAGGSGDRPARQSRQEGGHVASRPLSGLFLACIYKKELVMKLDEHPTVRRIHLKVVPSVPSKKETLDAGWLKQLVLDAGADDVGFVEIGRPALDDQRQDIVKAFPHTKTLISFVVRMNREAIRTPARSVSNTEFHHSGDEVNDIARSVVKTLEDRGIRAMNPAMGFPMEMDRFPGKVWVVSHKPVAVAAGLGMMGIHRNVIHEKFGNFILLGTILLDAEVSEASQPINYNPCLECKLCVAACPVGAISSEGDFFFSACYTHNYREFMGGFTDWVEQVADSSSARDYRRRVSDAESASMWQSLSFGANYKAAYCLAVCPAGEDVIGPFLADRKTHLKEIVRPLQEKEETIYVTKNSDAEDHVGKRFPHKRIKLVGNTLRPNSIKVFLHGMPNVFQPGKAAGLNATFHFTFTGHEQRQATVLIQDQRIRVEEGHVGQPDLHVTADSQTWIGFLRKEKNIVWALLRRKIRLAGPLKLLVAFGKCFPQ